MDELEKAEEVPSEIASTVTSIPETTIHVAGQGTDKSIDAMREIASSINSALGDLATVQRELLDHLKTAKEDVQQVVEEPIQGGNAQVEELVPEIEPPKFRTIRRNGRKVKRNA